LAQAIIPCRVSAATATVSGAYTGPGYNFVVSGDISYTAPATTTTATSTTTSTSTTSTSTTSTTAPSSTTSTTTGSTSTTTPGSSTTSTTTALTSTTSTTTPSSTTSTTAAPTTSTTAAPTTSTTAAPTTSTTAAPTTKTFDCNDIPLATSKLVLSKSRCVAPGETVTVSAPAGTFDGAPAAVTGMTVSAGSAFVVQCNPDPAIPLDGSGCNVTGAGGLGIGAIGDDGSLAPTNVVVASGAVGTDPRSVCPPTQAEANAGVINCVIGASPGGDVTKSLGAPFTVAGQTVVLPVDASGNATPPPTTPAGSGAAEVLGTTQISSAAVTPKGTLPYTGLGGNTWFIAGMAILLIDIGAVASSCAKRRMVG
jgi:hypothetical protein